MLSVSDRNQVIGLGQAFAQDLLVQRGGRAANNRRQSLHIKLLSLWVKSLDQLCAEVWGRPPLQVPAIASKYLRVVGRLNVVKAPGYFVAKGSPLLPRDPGSGEEDVSDVSSENSVVEAPIEISDVEAEPEAVPASSSSLEHRSEAPVIRARANSQSREPGLGLLEVSGRLPSGRLLPPEPPVAPIRPTSQGPKQKARPKPRVAPQIVPVANITHVERDCAAFGQSLTLLNRQASGVRAILSLDYHQVIDRSLDSTLEVFRCLQCHPHVAVIVLSKCSTRSLIEQALRFLERVVSITGYTIRDVPCFFVRDDLKADKLWRAIRGTDHEDTPVCHVDDKGSVVAGFESFSGYGWRGIRLAPSRRIELAEVVVPLITADQ